MVGGKAGWGQGILCVYWGEIDSDHSKLGSTVALLVEIMLGTGNAMKWMVAKD